MIKHSKTPFTRSGHTAGFKLAGIEVAYSGGIVAAVVLTVTAAVGGTLGIIGWALPFLIHFQDSGGGTALGDAASFAAVVVGEGGVAIGAAIGLDKASDKILRLRNIARKKVLKSATCSL